MSLEKRLLVQLRSMVTAPGAQGLADDVARLGDLVLSHDSLAEGVHYRPDDPPESVGWKLVAVNLSDLAGKGATPAGALLSLTIGDPPNKMLPGEWEEAFLRGVAAACESYGLPLLGGDTIALPDGAPRILGLSVMGHQPSPPPRSGAEDGDVLVLAGTLGDAMAGLAMLENDEKAVGALVDIYRRPIPLLAVGERLAIEAHAMMDVSDGLLLDAMRLAKASGLQASIALDDLPLSGAFRAARGDDLDARLFAASAGDDYALLAALPAASVEKLRLSLPSGTIFSVVGRLASGDGLVLSYEGKQVELPERLGFEHDRD